MAKTGLSRRDSVHEHPVRWVSAIYYHAGPADRPPLCIERRASTRWWLLARRMSPCYLAAADVETALLATVLDLAVYPQSITVVRRVAEVLIDLAVLDFTAPGALEAHGLNPACDPQDLARLSSIAARRKDVSGFISPLPDCMGEGVGPQILGVLPRALRGPGVEVREDYEAEAHFSFAPEVEIESV
jgi:hypothetical protein